MGTWDVGPFDNDAARDLLTDLRAGRFSLDQLRFGMSGNRIDADDAAVVVALSALSKMPAAELPAGLNREHVSELSAPGARSWLRSQFNHILDREASAIYALWEHTGELDQWIYQVESVKP
ncbi:DUF4259 domain-containing protein [Corynebacterium guangdongense]|uniref:DUF4259 domain-containing protein n=1 Tax=Corynebacterium guangdongense TaxID=1783348 RepID=A0ABU1ZWB7_9CORY|nr:DUF4259 domain-containing protein [Corynebacterium guangdongense]MDR7329237.1 hypothetical protein [Corynebacterium guangdongense]WJZ17803.1 hypothetical protein CGUA_06145 [Corynebacterium guangdongense]